MSLPSCLPADIAVADGPLRDEIVVQHDDVRFVAFFQTAAFAELEALDLVPAGRLDGLAERQPRDADETAQAVVVTQCTAGDRAGRQRRFPIFHDDRQAAERVVAVRHAGSAHPAQRVRRLPCQLAQEQFGLYGHRKRPATGEADR